MNKLILIVSMFFLSFSVMAAHCARDARSIDAALAKLELDGEQRAEVERLKTQGLDLHTNGDHRGAEKLLAEAMRILLDNVGTVSQQGMHMMDHGSMGNMQGGSCGNSCMEHMDHGNMGNMGDMGNK